MHPTFLAVRRDDLVDAQWRFMQVFGSGDFHPHHELDETVVHEPYAPEGA